MKPGQLVDIVMSNIFRYYLNELEEKLLNPGHFYFTKLPQLIKTAIISFEGALKLRKLFYQNHKVPATSF